MFVNRMPIFFDGEAGGSADPAPEPAADAGAPPVEGGVVEPEAPGAEVEVPEVVEEAVNWEDRITGWGGAETIEEAIAIQQALGTKPGLTALAEEALRALGVGNERIAEILSGESPAPAGETPANPLEALLGDDPDRLMSAREVLDIVQQLVDKEVKTPLAQERQQQFEATARHNVQSALTSVLGESYDEVEGKAVCDFAEKYIDQDGLQDGTKVAEALRRGKADFDAVVAKRHDAYLKEKQEAAEQHPTPLSGQSPGGEDIVEPADLEEAKRRVRAAIGL